MALQFHEDPSKAENQHFDEPQLTSDDPNERKLARKLRIERRWAVIRKTAAMEESESFQEGNKTAVQLQVQKSAEILEKFLEEAEEYVTNVRVANDSREVDRREVEGIGKEKVIAQLEDEAAAAHRMFEEIAVKWSVIQKYNDPLHINEDIANQKEKCELLIKQKDEIIAMLRDELKNAEIKFTKDQKKQSEDINILAQRIEKQITFMRQAYQTEFELIEDVIASERQNFIDSSNRKWEELYKKREQQETENSNKKFQQLGEFNNNMNKLRVSFQENFRETKIKLENDIEHLQYELERIKALALLNSEKLDYNYQILKKREDENLIIKSQQKRRINKLQDVKNDIRKKITDYEKTEKNHMKKLTEDIKKLHRSILEVEAKADHFAKVNDEKFHQIWEMNKNNCQSVLNSILSTDKILHEQQMGIDWDAPPHSIINKTTLSSFKDASNAISNASETEFKPSVDKKNSRKMETSDSESRKIQQKPQQLDANPIYRKLLKNILTLVSDKTGFLTEKRLKMLLKVYEDDQKSLVKLDNVFISLDIHRPDDIDLLIKYFIPYCFCPVCNSPDRGTDSTVISRYNSQLSHFSVFSRIDNASNLEIVELDEAFSAIQQPDNVIEEVVMDLVSSEIYSEGLNLEQESLENICGGIVLDQIYSDMKEKRGTKKKMITSEEKVLCQYNHPLVISSVFILMALREFVTAYYTQKVAIPTTRERLEKKRQTVSRLLSDVDIQLYWDKYKTIYSDERVRLWGALLDGLKNYHEILKDRKTLCEEVVDLRRQNEDLKRLLANYIDHGDFMEPLCAKDRDGFLHASPFRSTKNK